MLPAHDAPAQTWIERGLAVRTQRARGVDLGEIPFRDAQAKAYIYLTGKGAQELDREAQKQPARP